MLNHKNCPQCSGVLLLEAIVCRYCTHHFNEEEMAWARRKSKTNFWLKLGGIHILFALIVAAAFGVGRMKAQDEKANRARDTAEASPTPTLAPPPAVIDLVSRQFGSASSPDPVQPTEAAPSNDQPGAGAGAIWSALRAIPYLPAPDAGGAQGVWWEQDIGDADAGASTHVSVLESINKVQLPFPFEGGVRGELIVRSRAAGDRVLLFRVEKGPIWCSPDDPKHWIRVEIEGVWHSYACRDPGDGDGSYAFFKAPDPLFALLRQSKSFVVEVQFYDADPQRFQFTSGGRQERGDASSLPARG